MKTMLTSARGEAKSQSVRIPSARTELMGDLTIPTSAEGLVLFAHGSGSSRHSPRNQFVARIIQESGTATLLFDLLTAEEERADIVSRRYAFDIDFLARRLTEATRWIQQHPEAAHLSLGYFGSSTGAGAALVAAAAVGDVIHAVVSRGGRPDLAEEALARVKAPTLLIVGGHDEVVIDLNRAALAELTCSKELRIIPGATHLFEEPGALEEVARMASDWFHRYLHRQ